MAFRNMQLQVRASQAKVSKLQHVHAAEIRRLGILQRTCNVLAVLRKQAVVIRACTIGDSTVRTYVYEGCVLPECFYAQCSRNNLARGNVRVLILYTLLLEIEILNNTPLNHTDIYPSPVHTVGSWPLSSELARRHKNQIMIDRG